MAKVCKHVVNEAFHKYREYIYFVDCIDSEIKCDNQPERSKREDFIDQQINKAIELIDKIKNHGYNQVHRQKEEAIGYLFNLKKFMKMRCSEHNR